MRALVTQVYPPQRSEPPAWGAALVNRLRIPHTQCMTLRDRATAFVRPALVVVSGLASVGLAVLALGVLVLAVPLLGLAGCWHVRTFGG